MRHRSFVVAAVVAAVLGGCGATEPEPTVTPSAAADAADLLDTGQPLPAGRYTRTGFEPRIEVTLDGSWQAVQLFDGFFDVQQDVGSPHVIAVQFGRPSAISGPDGSVEPADAAEAAALVTANDRLTVVETGASRIGGLTGHRVTVANEGDTHAGILTVPPGPLGIDPGRRLWIAFFDTDAGLLAIMVGGSTERWEQSLAAAEPVLESVVIGP